MALPQQIKTARLTDASIANTIDDAGLGAAEQAIADILGIPVNTNITAKLMTVLAAGLQTLHLKDTAADPSAAGEFQRNAGNLKFHDGSVVKQVAFTDAPTTAHKDTHKSGGGDAFTSTDLLEAIVKRIQESAGPTTLTWGAVADGQRIKRSGTNLIGEVNGLPAPDFTSSEIALANDTQIDTAHSLGAIPTLVLVILRCKTADIGFGVGDEIIYSSRANALDRGATIFSDATNVSIVQGNEVMVIGATSKNQTLLTGASWKWVIRAWK